MIWFHSGLVPPVRRGAPTPPVRITQPEGTALTSDQVDVASCVAHLARVPARLGALTAVCWLLDGYC